MIGALALAFAIVVVLPVAFLVTAAILTAVMGWLLNLTRVSETGAIAPVSETRMG